ncbi:MAG: stage 0 sporulation family protein [bacterium]
MEIEQSNDIPTGKETSLILVEFKGRRREVYGNPQNLSVVPGQYVIVEDDRGFDAGVVARIVSEEERNGAAPTFNVIRVASEEDLTKIKQLREREVKVLTIAREKLIQSGLQMHLVGAEIRYDELKITFYFVAEGRIDFRQYVRDLAATFHVRIELRQIGIRDAVKYISGFGVCGQPLCCATFLESFRPITIQMVRVQRLIPNPFKLSGPCGRLKCCLAYELDLYPEAKLVELNLEDQNWEVEESKPPFSD